MSFCFLSFRLCLLKVHYFLVFVNKTLKKVLLMPESLARQPAASKHQVLVSIKEEFSTGLGNFRTILLEHCSSNFFYLPPPPDHAWESGSVREHKVGTVMERGASISGATDSLGHLSELNWHDRSNRCTDQGQGQVHRWSSTGAEGGKSYLEIVFPS